MARHLTFELAVAEDMVQETLLRAWRPFEQFEPGTNAGAWLFRILFNLYYAGERKRRSVPLVVPLAPSGRDPSTGSDFSMLDSAILGAALDELSEEHRTVILLVVVEGFTCREAAGILSLLIGTVMSRLSRARKSLRESLAPPAPKRLRVRAAVK